MFKRIRGKLVILLCATMIAEALYPAAGLSTVAAAEADTVDILSDPQVYEDADILDDVSDEEDVSYDGYDDTVYVEDPDRVSPESQDAANYFTEEEIEAAEAFYDSLEPEKSEPSEAEIEAEIREKERIKAETGSRMLDDSYKLDDTYEGTYEAEDVSEVPAEGGLFSSEEKISAKVGDEQVTLTINDLMKRAASERKPVYLSNHVRIVKTAVIPEGKTVTIYLCGYDLAGSQSELGKNPIFRLQKESTLKIYGKKGTLNSINNGADGAIIAGDRSNLRLEDLIITKNHASGNGGGLYLGEKVKCELYNVKIHENKADKGGGGLCVAGTLTNVSTDADTEITGNEAEYGGGIYINKAKVNLYGPAVGKTLIKDNKANDGGGIYFYAKDIAGNGFSIINNRATSGYGGGVRMEITGTSLANCEIKGNSAAKDGGGVYLNGKVGTLTDVIVQENTCGASYNGGGIYVDSMDNLSSGGKFNVTGNHKQGKTPSDLCLQDGEYTEAYLHAASYLPGSKIGIYTTTLEEGRQITFEPGNFNPGNFISNVDGWYIASNSDRHLCFTKNKAEALKAEVEKVGGRNSKKNSSQKSSYTYEAANGKNYDVYEGYASSPSHTDEKKEIVNKYFYSDGYFFDDPKTYNPHLATFGMNLAMASADTNTGGHSDYSYKFDNVKSLMRGIGCKDEDIWISPSYIVKPTDSSVGVAIGSKTITDKDENDKYTLVPIAVRSYNYEKEWASNMTIDGGNTKDEVNAESSGFRHARTKVMDAIRSYISNYGLDAQLSRGRVKFFIVGFSRGSATANLTSKALVDEYGELSGKYKDKPNQVFGYCFAVPSGGTDSCDTSLKRNRTAYYCIHNIINKVDLTPMVAPKEMGFKRYGVDHYVPGNDAGPVRTTTESATADNGSYKITMFYDNDAWYTDSSAYRVKKPSMLKQLMLINDEINFVDYFKETDIDIGIGNAIESAIRGIFTESSPIERNEVKNSKVIIENWLPKFYKTAQTYNTVGRDEKLTRRSYSSTVVRAGSKDAAGNGKMNWYSKGKTAQDTFRGLVQMMLSKTPTEKANLGAAFSGVSGKLGVMDLAGVYFDLINSSTGWDESGELQQDYLDMFWNYLKDNRYGQKAIQDAVTDPVEMADLENYYPSLMSIIFRLVRQDFNDSEHSGHIRLFGTFAANSEAILQGHVPEIALAWLRSYDSYYVGETRAYEWDGESDDAVSPGTVSLSINGAAVTAGQYTGDQVVKLSSTNPADAIYYSISAGNAIDKPVTLLYNDRTGIPLEGGDTETGTAYQIKAWTKCSRANSDGTVGWHDGTAVTQGITVKGEEAKHIQLSVEKYGYDNGSWDVKSAENVPTGVNYKKGQRCVFDLSKQLDMNGWSCKRWNYGSYSGSQSNLVDLIAGDTVTVNVDLYPLIKKVKIDGEVVSSIKPVAEAECKREISANKVFAGFADDLVYQSSEIPLGDGTKAYTVAWEQYKDGKYVPAGSSVFAGDTKYRAYITIDEGDNEKGLKYDDSVTVEGSTSEGINISGSFNYKQRKLVINIEYDSTSASEVTVSDNEMHSVYVYGRDISTPLSGTEYYTPGNARFTGSAIKGDHVLVDYDSIYGYESFENDLVSWNKITINGDNITETPLQDNSNAIWQEIGDDDVYLEAVTALFLDEVSIELKKPETGEGLPDHPEEIDFGMGGDLYSIDPESVSVTWTASENSIQAPVVRSKTTYTADVFISANEVNEVKEDGTTEPLGLRYFAGDFTDTAVNGVYMDDSDSRNSDIAYIGLTVEEDGDGLAAGIHIYITYTMTDKAKFLSVEPPEGLNLSFNALTKNSRFENDVKPNLPKETAVFVNDGSIQTLSVNWVKDIEQTIYDEDGSTVIYHVVNGVAYENFGYAVSANELNGLDDHNIYLTGYVVLPDDMAYETYDDEGEPVNEDIRIVDNEVYCYFDYPVYLGGAPETNMPEILPISGDYEPATQEVVVDFNTFPKTGSANSVDVYYKINYYSGDEGRIIQDDDDDDDDDDDAYDDVYDNDPPCYIGENGQIVISEGAHKYVPFDADSEKAAKDLEYRTITRDKLKEKDADMVKVSAIAVEKGDFRLSSMSEEYYMFLNKPTADIPEETMEALNNLTVESGMKLESIKLPENCRWDRSTDIYKVQDGIAGDHVDAVVIYNNDPDNYGDLVLNICIELKPGTYTLTEEDCKAYFVEEGKEPGEWKQTGTAMAGNEIYVRADSKDNMEISDWIVIDDAGTEIEYECSTDSEGNYDLSAIAFYMPRGNVMVKPVMTDKEKVTATVNSITLDKTDADLRKNDSMVVNALAVYGDAPADAIKPEITFRSSDPSVVSVTYNGGTATLRALSSGRATVWAYCADKSATCVVTVGEVYVNIELTNAQAYDVNGNLITDNTAVKGQSVTLKANDPKNASEVFVKWNITSGAVPDKGDENKSSIRITLLTDLVAEALYDTATEYKDKGDYGQKAVRVKKFTVTQTDPVSKKEKKVSRLFVDKDQAATVNAAAEYDQKQSVKPEIVFRSSNNDVAVVKTVKTGEGKAQAVIVGCRPGIAMITAYCGNKTSKITVTVGDKEVTGVTLFSERLSPNKTDDGQYVLELYSGEQDLIDLNLNPYNTIAETRVKWKSDDTKVATVRDGLVTAQMKDRGHTTITVTTQVKPLGAKKWRTLDPVKIVVRVKQLQIPKKQRLDKTYNISMKGSQTFDLNAGRINRRNILSGNTVQAILSRTFTDGEKDFVWESTNENIVRIDKFTVKPISDSRGRKSIVTADIRATGIGTAYIVLTGIDKNDKTKVNRAVMKVVVKATSPQVYFTNDVLGLLSDDGKTLTIKEGSCDRLFMAVKTENVRYGYNTTEKIKISGSGGVSVTNGVLYAKKATKPGRPAKVTIKCGKTKTELFVTVK